MSAPPMTTAEHRARHQLLHRYFDELLADFIGHTRGPVLSKPIRELLEWSHRQTIEPDDLDASRSSPDDEGS